MKALSGDKVAVMKVHADTETKFMVMAGTLTAIDRGRKTEDKRAHGEEGDCPTEMEVAAKGWCVVTTEDGKRHSVSQKDVVVYSQKVVLEHNATMEKAREVAAEREAHEENVEKARAFCESKGLDTDNLSDANMLRIVELFE